MNIVIEIKDGKLKCKKYQFYVSDGYSVNPDLKFELKSYTEWERKSTRHKFTSTNHWPKRYGDSLKPYITSNVKIEVIKKIVNLISFKD